MTLLAVLTIYVTSGHKSNGGSVESTIASASSRMPLLQHVNYVFISGEDFRAFAEKPTWG